MKNHPSKEQASRRKSTSSLSTSSKSKSRRFSDSSVHKTKKNSQSNSPTPLSTTANTTNHYNQNYFYFNDDVIQTITQNVDNGNNDERNEHKLTNMEIFASPTTSPFEQPHQSMTTTNSCHTSNINSSNTIMNTSSTSNYIPPAPTNDSIINSHSNQIINSMNFNELSNCIVTIENNNHHQQHHHQHQILTTSINPTNNSTTVNCPFQYGEIESNSITTVSCDAGGDSRTTGDRLLPPYLIYPNGVVDNSCCYNNSSIGNNHLVDDTENNIPSPLYSDDDNNENENGCSLINQQEESEFIQIDFMNSDYIRKLLSTSNDNDNFDDLENYFKDIF